MTDPTAAAQQNDAAPSSTEPVPNGAGGASLDATSSPAASAPDAPLSGEGDVGNVVAVSEGAEPPASGESGSASNASNENSASDAGQNTAEHPHTSLLRRMTETLRRKWNVFDSEIEAILKDAEGVL